MIWRAKTKVICDFDGTVTFVDTTDALLTRFAPPEWEDVEKEWIDGSITSRECMERQVAMIRAGRDELDACVDAFDVRPGFRGFVEFCRGNGVDLRIVSDGIDYVISRVLRRHGFSGIPVVANHFVFRENGYGLTFPGAKDGCRFGMCKCGAADVGNGITVLIGDSHSDTCVAERASAVYAVRGRPLETHCRKNGIDFTPFDDFHDILSSIKQEETKAV